MYSSALASGQLHGKDVLLTMSLGASKEPGPGVHTPEVHPERIGQVPMLVAPDAQAEGWVRSEQAGVGPRRRHDPPQMRG